MGLKLNGTHQLLRADDVNILGDTINSWAQTHANEYKQQ
jgi:hypothetical protein